MMIEYWENKKNVFELLGIFKERNIRAITSSYEVLN